MTIGWRAMRAARPGEDAVVCTSQTWREIHAAPRRPIRDRLVKWRGWHCWRCWRAWSAV